MCGNRVEELESRVQELEASVEGLTDELVECKVRLRELENAVDDELGFVPETNSESSDDEVTAKESSVGVEVETADESPAEAEETKTEDAESEDNTEEESDIIIA
jgi:uncharacterized coiled-coil protein SlyX